MSTLTMTVKDARDLSFTTRDAAIDVVIRLMKERDELLEALNNLVDYIDIIPTDLHYRDETRELMDAARAAIKAAEQTP